MKRFAIASVCVAAAGATTGITYNVNPADMDAFFAGNDHLELLSVSIWNTANRLHVVIRTNGDLDATTWGKYVMGINTGAADQATDNPWGRLIDWNGQTIDHWIGSWTDDGGSGVGGQVWDYAGGAWSETGPLFGGDDSQHAAGVTIFDVSLADLGVGIGDIIFFGIASTGGGADPGVDHLSVNGSSVDNWGINSVAGQFLTYQIEVPTPGAAALLGLGGLLALRRRRA